MIKKLKSKIFLILMISLSVITIGVVVLFTISNYRNTINTSAVFMDRFLKPNSSQGPNGEKNNPQNDEQMGINENQNSNPSGNPNNSQNEILPFPETTDQNNNTTSESRETSSNDIQQVAIDGFYRVKVSTDGSVTDANQEIDDSIKNIALKASKKKMQSGVIENYIYKLEKNPEGDTMVMLVYNEQAVSHIQIIILLAIILTIIFEIIIYLISIKLSEWIVKPVDETFNKQKQFISDASHELKTPLAVIEANTEVLESNIGENKWLTYIKNEIESMNKLISELLLLAKMENLDSINDTEKFDLSQETEIAVSTFESMAFEKQVKLETNIEKNIMFNGRKEDVKHIISTLVDNAIKHTSTKVEVDLIKEKEFIILNVKNEGEEIPEDEREKIFERFYRVDKARNRDEKRYGLGLAIAKSTVEKYNGSIKVNCKDGITDFIVKIPC